MGKHTPGPWGVSEASDSRQIITGPDGSTVAVLPAYLLTDGRALGRTNARLITAAPDLLAVAKGLAAWDGTDDHLARLAEQARAAIAKVEGRED